MRKASGSLSISQRGCLIKRIGLLFDQCQVMKRIEDVIFFLPGPDMAGNDLSPAGNHPFMHIAPCVFRGIRPVIPTTSGHLNRGIRPPLFSGFEA